MSNYMFEEFRTKITGTTMGDEAQLRQKALSILQKKMAQEPKNLGLRHLELVPEPDNPYDANAIRVMKDLSELGGRVQLGFVKNSDTICELCGGMFERFPQNGQCPRCGDKENLKREGIATKIANMMRADPKARFYAEILEVTGGVGAKANFGCNILIRKVSEKNKSGQQSSQNAKPRRQRPATVVQEVLELGHWANVPENW